MASRTAKFFCACFVVYSTSAKTPLHVGVFFPMSGQGWTGGNGVLPAIQIALEDVNRSNILPNYELQITWNDTVGHPGRAMSILYRYLHDAGRKIFILGAGYSSCSTAIASLAGIDSWRIPQISFASTSPKLSDKTLYPYFYRTIPADSSFNRPRIALLRAFNWSHVATIYHSDEDIHSTAISDLQRLFRASGIHEIISESFRDDATNQMANIKKKDARIIIGNFFGKGARKVFCQAYKLKMYGPRYVWIVLGYIEEEWWTYNDTSVDCTPNQMLEAANGYLATNNLWHAPINHTTVSGKKIAEFYNEYNSRVPQATRDLHSGYAYDAVWAMAIALNKTLSQLPPHVRLDKIPYGDKTFIDLILKALNETSFFGITGPVSFTAKGDRVGDTEFLQLLDGEKYMVGLYENHKDAIDWSGYKHKIVWAGGAPPADRVRRVYRLMTVSLELSIFMGALSTIGIFISFIFLWFNTSNRKVRFIKMSSPKLNNVIICGCVLNYISVFLFGLNGSMVSEFESVCVSRAWFLTVGFSLAYGAMFSKTWRVHVIFTNKKLRRKVVKDYHLFGVVLVLLVIDLVCLVTWHLVDPLRRVVRDSTSVSTSLDEMLVNQLEYCESTYTFRWVGVLFGYKGLLLLFGAFLAWETRNVTISALNDSKYIGMSVYNVFVLCVIGAPISFIMADKPDTAFAITSTSIIFCTSITLSLVFIPKILEMRKNSAAINDRENMGRTFTSYGLGRTGVPSTINLSQEVLEYQKKLEERDKQIQQLKLDLEAALKKSEDKLAESLLQQGDAAHTQSN